MGLDPLVGLHTIPENANSEMSDLIMAIKGVTETCDVAGAPRQKSRDFA
jgi:hypothetical protein